MGTPPPTAFLATTRTTTASRETPVPTPDLFSAPMTIPQLLSVPDPKVRPNPEPTSPPTSEGTGPQTSKDQKVGTESPSPTPTTSSTAASGFLGQLVVSADAL